MKTIIRISMVGATLLVLRVPVSAQVSAAEAQRRVLDTIPVDTIVSRYEREVVAGGDPMWAPRLWDYVIDPGSSKGDTIFEQMAEIVKTSDNHSVLSRAVDLVMRGEAAKPGQRTAAVAELFQNVLDDPGNKHRYNFLAEAQYASPQFRSMAAGWISGALARGDVLNETDTEILVGRLGDLGDPGIAALRRLIENEQLPPMFGGLHRAREMLQRAIERQGGGGSG